MRRLLPWIACALWLAAAPLAAGEIYVNNAAGDDRFTGRAPQATPDGSGPLRTIAQALRLATAGDHLVLAKTEQPYRESISLVGSRLSGLPGQPLVIEGEGVVLDGSAAVPPQAWRSYRDAVFCFRPAQTGYQQLFLDDRPAVRVPVGYPAGNPPRLEPRQWCLLDGEIYFCVEPDKLPSDYRLSYSRLTTGITLYQVEHVAIVGLCVQGFQLDGISAFNSARAVRLVGVTCRGNGHSGVTVGGASTVDIEGILLGNNGQAQLLTLPCSETHIRRSHLLSNTAPGWVDQGGRVFLGDQRVEGGRDEIKGSEVRGQGSGARGQPPSSSRNPEPPDAVRGRLPLSPVP
jgi:hypothetical protein